MSKWRVGDVPESPTNSFLRWPISPLNEVFDFPWQWFKGI